MAKLRNKTEIITGIDVGSTAIRIVVAQLTINKDSENDLQIIGAVETPSEGIVKGVINSIEETVSSISNALEHIERIVGVPIENAWLGITGSDIITQESRGVISVAKSDGEIAEEDMDRAVEAAQAIVSPPNYDILHVIPRNFTVDGQEGIKDPVGMTGMRMEVNTQIIHILTSHLKNLKRSVYRAGLDIEDVVLSVMATGEVVVTPKQKDLGVVVVNIGGATTSLVVYEGGDVRHTAVIPIGSEHITNDLAIGLRTPVDVAEKVKIEWGNCLPDSISEMETINLGELGSPDNEEVSLKEVSEIIEARASEILEKVDQELMKIDRSGLLPAGVILTGAGSKISGLVDLAKKELRLPAGLGYPIDIKSISEKTGDLSFATAVGLVRWGSTMQRVNKRKSGTKFERSGKILKTMKNLLSSFMP